MAEDRMDAEFLEQSEATLSRDGSKLFVDLGAGAGAVPVRADLGKHAVLRSSHAMVVGFMCVLAAGGIMLMRQFGLGVSSASADIGVDITRTERPKVEAARFESLMSTLESGDRPLQISPNKIARPSPFELAVEGKVAAEATPRETPEERAAREAAEARAKAERERAVAIEKAFADLKLVSVVGGRNPAARINTQIVREGDTVAEFFTVKRILPRSVVLDLDGKEYELMLAGAANRP